MVPLLPLIFRFRRPEGFRLSEFPEAVWRGAFGYSLKQTVCVMRLRPCVGCAFEFSCAYPFIFETRPGAEASIMRDADRTPHPYLLRVFQQTTDDEQDRFDLGMTLIGPAARHLSFVIHALGEAGRRGIGRARSPMPLEAVIDSAGEEIWTPGRNLPPREPAAPALRLSDAPRLSISFDTPMRLVRDHDPIAAEALDGPTLAFAAVRRVELLRTCFGGADPATDHAALKDQAQAVKIIDRDLSWVDRRRYSTRQKRPITLGGVIGNVTLDVSGAPDLTPYLETCGFVHLGKSTTLGFGRMSLAAA